MQKSFLLRAVEEFFPEAIMIISLPLVTRTRESRQTWEKCLQPQLSQISVKEEKARKRKKIMSFYPPCAGERWVMEMLLPLFSTFWRLKKLLICPIKAISYSSEEYFSLLFLSLMQLSVSSDPPCVLPHIYFCSSASQCQWENQCTRYFIYRAISSVSRIQGCFRSPKNG